MIKALPLHYFSSSDHRPGNVCYPHTSRTSRNSREIFLFVDIYQIDCNPYSSRESAPRYNKKDTP